MDDWIPISITPKKSGVYLVFAESADPEIPFIGTAWYELPGTENMPGWQLFPVAIVDSLSHWMPLPKRPSKRPQKKSSSS